MLNDETEKKVTSGCCLMDKSQTNKISNTQEKIWRQNN